MSHIEDKARRARCADCRTPETQRKNDAGQTWLRCRSVMDTLCQLLSRFPRRDGHRLAT